MATDQLLAPLPSIILAPGMKVRFEAVDPTTGAAVAGVTVKSMSVVGPKTDVTLDELGAGPFLLVPGPEA